VRPLWIVVLLSTAAASAPAAEFKAGLARIAITPKDPVWMSGYAARTHPSEGIVHDLWAKALAIEDRPGKRFVFVTLDLLVIPRAIADEVASAAKTRYGLDRDRIAISASHTHAAPEVRTLPFALPESESDRRILADYRRKVTDSIISVIGAALHDLSAAQLEYGRTSAAFAINRRQSTPDGYKIATNPNGPTDHDVPVIVVRGSGDRVRGILFGYACHNTTTVADFYSISGDYAGFAQLALEEKFPGATAMFMALCAGDQNPNPRGKLELAEQHGKELADSVASALAGQMRRLHPPLRAAFQTAQLRFAPHTREMYEKRLSEKDVWRVRHAKYIIGTYEEGKPIRTVDYPVQAVRFGNDLTIVLLGGEVVVDYCLRAKLEYTGEPIVVAAYSNDVMSYIPSLRVLKEGGYEADSSMIYYGLPGPYDDSVEETVFAAIRKVTAKVGRKR
jgi:neutral ceramidase